MAARQCPRRLWLEVYRPELRRNPPSTELRFAVGDLVGALARSLYDPDENGVLIDVMEDGAEAGIARTATLLERRVPIFEAGFAAAGARAFVDILRPSRRGGGRSWDLIEVKSSAGVKNAHREDIAIQTYVLRSAGLKLNASLLAHVDTGFVYQGDGNYAKLLREVDLSVEASARETEVAGWIAAAQRLLELAEMPAMQTGDHCRLPHRCSFLDYCRAQETPVLYPVHWLPRLHGNLRDHVNRHGVRDLAELPDELLSARQQRVKHCTLADTVYFDRAGAQAALASLQQPLSFLDFEAVQLAIPIWPGTRPYQTLPFQFSLHCQRDDGSLQHHEHLDLSGAEPSRQLAQALLAACPAEGSILAWNASFERARLIDLAERFSELRAGLLALEDRLFDLAEVVEMHYYHPTQKGSWKLKRVLPALAPELDHLQAGEVHDGHLAVLAYTEAIQPDVEPARKAQLAASLSAYCRLDSLALVRIWAVMAGVS